MSGPAKVHSTDAIEAVRLALVIFVDRVTDALAELSSEMRRVQEWLEHDRPKHWKNQIRLAMDQAHEAQQALHRCLMFPIADERPTCYEERAELKKAKARLEYCQEKSDRVRHWQQTMRHELFEYEGRMSQLVKLIEIEVPQAIGVLNRIIRNLEEYHAVRAADPRSSYDDVAIAKAIWSGGETDSDKTHSAAEEIDSGKEVAGNDRDNIERIESKT
jgi:exonuclease VII large subunit